MCPMGYKGYFFCVPSFVTPSEAHPRTKASGRARPQGMRALRVRAWASRPLYGCARTPVRRLTCNLANVCQEARLRLMSTCARRRLHRPAARSAGRRSTIFTSSCWEAQHDLPENHPADAEVWARALAAQQLEVKRHLVSIISAAPDMEPAALSWQAQFTVAAGSPPRTVFEQRCPFGCGLFCDSAPGMEEHKTECLMAPRKLLAEMDARHAENKRLRAENDQLWTKLRTKDEDLWTKMLKLRAENTERLHASAHKKRMQAKDRRHYQAGTSGTHFVALPVEIIVQVLAWLPEVFSLTTGDVLATVGACCKAFAIPVREAAQIIAGRHGWRLPAIGSAPMHLSKLEQDTARVRYYLTIFRFWTSSQIQFVDRWAEEMSPGFIGALSIDPQVRQQHTLELGELLIKIVREVHSDDRQRDKRIAKVFKQLVQLMAQPGTPLDASWLLDILTLDEWTLEVLRCPKLTKTRRMLTKLLGYIEPCVLRAHPKTFLWLSMTSTA